MSTFNLDGSVSAANWIKFRWDLPPYKSKSFMNWLKKKGRTLQDFKQSVTYELAVEHGYIRGDKWSAKTYADDVKADADKRRASDARKAKN